MNDYYEKSLRALKLAGMRKSTQECYTRSVRQIVDFYNKTPDLISKVELEDYFLHRRNEDLWSAATLRIAHCAIRFFFQNVLKRDWQLLTYMNCKESWPKGPGFGETPKRGLVCLAPRGGKGSRPE